MNESLKYSRQITYNCDQTVLSLSKGALGKLCCFNEVETLILNEFIDLQAPTWKLLQAAIIANARFGFLRKAEQYYKMYSLRVDQLNKSNFYPDDYIISPHFLCSTILYDSHFCLKNYNEAYDKILIILRHLHVVDEEGNINPETAIYRFEFNQDGNELYDEPRWHSRPLWESMIETCVRVNRSDKAIEFTDSLLEVYSDPIYFLRVIREYYRVGSLEIGRRYMADMLECLINVGGESTWPRNKSFEYDQLDTFFYCRKPLLLNCIFNDCTGLLNPLEMFDLSDDESNESNESDESEELGRFAEPGKNKIFKTPKQFEAAVSQLPDPKKQEILLTLYNVINAFVRASSSDDELEFLYVDHFNISIYFYDIYFNLCDQNACIGDYRKAAEVSRLVSLKAIKKKKHEKAKMYDHKSKEYALRAWTLQRARVGYW